MARKNVRTIEHVDADLAALAVEVSEIEQWKVSITREIADQWGKDTSKLQADYAGATARLEAAAIRRERLENERRELRATLAIEAAQERAREMFDLELKREQQDQQIARLRAALADAEKTRTATDERINWLRRWRRNWLTEEFPDLTDEQRAAAQRAYSETLAARRGDSDQQVA